MEKRLGRGLGSLLSQSSAQSPPKPEMSTAAPATSGGQRLPLAEIRANPFQPRTEFDAEGLEELAASIRQHGILQPVVVRRSASGFELVSGERRLRASKLAGLTSIPAMVREQVSDDEMLELAMVENLQRRDLDPMERARGYQRMIDQLKLTQAQVAERVGLKRSTVTNHLRLLELPPGIHAQLANGQLTMGHAKALLAADEAQRQALAVEIVHEGLSVREAERRARGDQEPTVELQPKAPPLATSRAGASAGSATADPKAPWVRDLENRLRDEFGTKAEVNNREGYSGTIVLHYHDRASLEQMMQALVPKASI
jgi:ParB family transcriptional regulator, chromosome partitioning protein